MVDKNSPQGKGFRTFYQTVGATVLAYFYGLWNLPGVSEYTTQFLENQGFELLIGAAALIGIPAGLIAYLQNRRGK